MQGNSTLMSGHTQKVLSCIEVGFTSQTTPGSVMTWCMCTMQLQSQDTPDNGRHWNWCCGTTGGQCHGTTSLPLLHPPLAASDPIRLLSVPSASTLLQL